MELLNQLDGFEDLGQVKMVMATNRPGKRCVFCACWFRCRCIHAVFMMHNVGRGILKSLRRSHQPANHKAASVLQNAL